MNENSYFEALRGKLLGQTVTDRLLAGNSLSIWVNAKPQERSGWTIWLEPSWHLLGPEGVLAGSRQAQDEEAPSGFQAVAEIVEALVGLSVEDLDVDPRTGDLTVTFRGGMAVRTFVADPRDDFLWRIRSLSGEDSLFGTPTGLRIHPSSSGV
jgi:hypothetical protein